MVHIVVIGGNFAGLTSALELKRGLGNTCKVTIISKSPFFLYVPSLIWIPFGKRELKDITLPLEPITKKAQVEFVCATVTQILPQEKSVKCNGMEITYNYLIIATGPEWIYNQAHGMGLESNISYVVTPHTAMEARRRWVKFIKNPGPTIIGSVPGAQFTPHAYELLFNFEKRCRDLKIRGKVDITYITPEPFLGHFGIDGVAGSEFLMKRLFAMLNIKYHVNAEIKKATPESIYLSNGYNLPYDFSIIMPKFKGPNLIENSSGLGTNNDFLPVNDGFQHKTYPNIFGVGAVADLSVSLKTPVPVGVPSTGYAANVSAKIAVHNIINLVRGNDQFKCTPLAKLPELQLMDIGDKELLALMNHILKPRKFSVILPNLVFNPSKHMVEKYFLWKMKHGYSWLV